MATIVTRAGKGSALTFTEGDANFTNLNNDKLELTDLSVGAEGTASGDGSISYNNTTGVFTYTPPDLSSYLTSYTETDPVVGAVTGIVKADGAGNITAAISGTDYLASETFTELSQDTTPQLGGDLDVNGNSIVSATNGDITIAPNGTGIVNLETNSVVLGSAGDTDIAVTTVGAIPLIIDTNNGTTTGSITVNAGANGNIEIVPDGTGKTVVDNINYNEKVHSLGTTDTPTLTVSNGNVQTVTITSGLTIPAFSDAATGQSMTLLVTGSGTASGTGSHKFAGGNTTLTSYSVISIFYDGTTYWTSIATDFQ